MSDCKCGNEATQDSPEPLCRSCWYDWFTEDWNERPEDREFNRNYFIEHGRMPEAEPAGAT